MRAYQSSCSRRRVFDGIVRSWFAGGGGYGAAFERDPEAVEQDVRNGYVSTEKAREEYGVVIEPDSLKVDLVKTEKIRAAKAK